MPRHRFDPVALVVGAVFVAAGVIVLAGGELIDEGRALVPAGLIAVGVALLVHVGRRGRPPAPAEAVAPTAPLAASDRDLDTLFAPVDDALADWDRTHAAGPTDETDPARADTADAGTTRTDAAAEDITEVDVTRADTAEVGAGEEDATRADPGDEDVTEVIDPTERHPQPGPE